MILKIWTTINVRTLTQPFFGRTKLSCTTLRELVATSFRPAALCTAHTWKKGIPKKLSQVRLDNHAVYLCFCLAPMLDISCEIHDELNKKDDVSDEDGPIENDAHNWRHSLRKNIFIPICTLQATVGGVFFIKSTCPLSSASSSSYSSQGGQLKWDTTSKTTLKIKKKHPQCH